MKTTKLVLCLSGRRSATSAVLIADHNCVPLNQNTGKAKLPDGTMVQIVTEYNHNVMLGRDKDTTEVWIHEETQVDGELIAMARRMFYADKIKNI